jgi:hypothetical protein
MFEDDRTDIITDAHMLIVVPDDSDEDQPLKQGRRSLSLTRIFLIKKLWQRSDPAFVVPTKRRNE